jgi:hypothetical protein
MTSTRRPPPISPVLVTRTKRPYGRPALTASLTSPRYEGVTVLPCLYASGVVSTQEACFCHSCDLELADLPDSLS